ncbi:hypothetical protein EDB85DRAFT_1901062 [Lactarius pseudohatsudake]|nr:hypothetical protein EDB85DRAFT_1901062 [Lactarius pseudohatsudake]
MISRVVLGPVLRNLLPGKTAKDRLGSARVTSCYVSLVHFLGFNLDATTATATLGIASGLDTNPTHHWQQWACAAYHGHRGAGDNKQYTTATATMIVTKMVTHTGYGDSWQSANTIHHCNRRHPTPTTTTARDEELNHDGNDGFTTTTTTTWTTDDSHNNHTGNSDDKLDRDLDDLDDNRDATRMTQTTIATPLGRLRRQS